MGDLVGFPLGVASTIINAGLNYDSMARQYDYSTRLAAQQNQANLNMWNLNNAYNSPLQQMARLKAAGLNPQLAYGNQPQSDSPQMVGGSTPSSQITPLTATDMANLALLKAQKNNVDADTATKLKDVDLKGSEVELNQANIKMLGVQYKWTETQIAQANKQIEVLDKSLEESQARIEQMAEQIKLIQAQRDLTESQAASAYVDSLFAYYRNTAEYRELVSKTNLNNAQIKQILTILPLDAAQIEQNTKNLKKQNVLLVQAIKTGKVPANIASKYGSFMEFCEVLKLFQSLFQLSIPDVPKLK